MCVAVVYRLKFRICGSGKPGSLIQAVPRLPVNQPVDNFMATLCADGDIKAGCEGTAGLGGYWVNAGNRSMADTPHGLRHRERLRNRQLIEAEPNEARLRSPFFQKGLLHAAKDRAPGRRLERGAPSQDRGPSSNIK